jgi:hypothetical protein
MRFVSTAFVMIAMVLMLLALTLLTTTSDPDVGGPVAFFGW